MTGRLSNVGKELHTRVRRLFDTPLDAEATPLELTHAVLDDVERRVQPLGRGRRVFPYTRLVVRVRQATPDRAPIEAAFQGLDTRIRERLAELQCDPPVALAVRLQCLRKAPSDWSAEQQFAVEYGKDAEAQTPLAPDVAPPALRVTIVKGAATEQAYTFTNGSVSIGRTADPIDDLGHVRRNHVAFLDSVDGVTETVGRAHARLRFNAGTGECLVFDEGSSNGTAVIRGGTTIPVPAREPRGVRMKSGDELQIGRALLKVEIG